MSAWRIEVGDVLDVLRTLPDASFSALLSDPPYGLGTREPELEDLIGYLRGESLDTGGDFMGKRWQIPSVDVWREAYRVLKPGAHMLVFAGTRTVDLIALGIRAAGFEIRDCLMFLHAQGFPKSLQVDKAIDAHNGDERPAGGQTNTKCSYWPNECKGHGRSENDPLGVTIHRMPTSAASAAWSGWGTALKPALEPIILARKPLDGTVAHTALTHGTGGINIDGCRIGYVSNEDMAAAAAAAAAQRLCRDQNENRVAYGSFDNGEASLQPYLDKQALGRWPANVVFQHADGCELVGADRVDGHKGYPHGPGGSSSQLSQRGVATNRRQSWAGHADADGKETVERWTCVDGCPVAELDRQSGDRPGMSGGGAHREGAVGGMFGAIDSTHTARGDSGFASRFYFCSKPSSSERYFGCEHLSTAHPTLKAIALTKWLATLLLPPVRADGEPRGILVPYCGSGSECIGALRAGWDEIVGIQRAADAEEAAYIEIAKARMSRWAEVRMDLDEADAISFAKPADERQTSLFGASSASGEYGRGSVA